MSKRHHATRRRSYGRRQHELHQREDPGRPVPWGEAWDEVYEPAFRDDRSRTARESIGWSRPGDRD